MIGLPAPECGSPNTEQASELPLVQAQLFAFRVDMLADGFGMFREQRANSMNRPVGWRQCDYNCAIANTHQCPRIVLTHAPRQPAVWLTYDVGQKVKHLLSSLAGM